MNERINKLFGQALDEAVPETWTTLDPTQLSRLKEKFAELIVRECAGLCSTHEMADEPFGVKSYRKGHHFDVMIRQHFGVE